MVARQVSSRRTRAMPLRGTFPGVSLKSARQRCGESQAQLAAGVDPAAECRLAKQQIRMKDESFEVIAREWNTTFSPNWASSQFPPLIQTMGCSVVWLGLGRAEQYICMRASCQGHSGVLPAAELIHPRVGWQHIRRLRHFVAPDDSSLALALGTVQDSGICSYS